MKIKALCTILFFVCGCSANVIRQKQCIANTDCDQPSITNQQCGYDQCIDNRCQPQYSDTTQQCVVSYADGGAPIESHCDGNGECVR